MSDEFVKFDPPKDAFTQVFTLLLPDGTPFNVTMEDVGFFHTYTIKLAINRGVMIGACIIMLVTLGVLTKREKRRSPIFYLNMVALLLTAIRQILVAIFLVGPFQHPYAVVAGDWDRVTGIDYSNSIAVPVLTTMTLAVILTSLLLQVNVISATMQRLHRIALVGVCCAGALVALGFQFAWMIINCRNIIHLVSWTEDLVTLQKKVYGSLLATLLIFTLIFTFKLGMAIMKRRKLGLRNFGPMQVIFIMSVQTLIVPTVIASLQFVPGDRLPEMNAWFLTLIVLSLPLSSLWASASLDGSKSNVSSHANISGFSSTKSHDKSIFSQKSLGSFSGPSQFMDTKVTSGLLDVEAQHEGIQSEKTWEVRRDSS